MSIPKEISKITTTEIFQDDLLIISKYKVHPREPNREALTRIMAHYDELRSKEESLSKAQA